jgi:hypothetical protein
MPCVGAATRRLGENPRPIQVIPQFSLSLSAYKIRGWAIWEVLNREGRMLTKEEFEGYASRFKRMATQTKDDATRKALIEIAEKWLSMAAEQESAAAPSPVIRSE